MIDGPDIKFTEYPAVGYPAHVEIRIPVKIDLATPPPSHPSTEDPLNATPAMANIHGEMLAHCSKHQNNFLGGQSKGIYETNTYTKPRQVKYMVAGRTILSVEYWRTKSPINIDKLSLGLI